MRLSLRSLAVALKIILVASLQLDASTLQRPSAVSLFQNQTINSTSSLLGNWPDVPFKQHVARDMSLEIFAYGRTEPQATEIEVLESLEIMQLDLETSPDADENVILVSLQYSWVRFYMDAYVPSGHQFTKINVSSTLDVIYGLTLIHGPREIRGWVGYDGQFTYPFFLLFGERDTS